MLKWSDSKEKLISPLKSEALPVRTKQAALEEELI